MSFGCMLHLLDCDDYTQGTYNKEVRKSTFCSLSIADAANIDLTGNRAVDGSPDDIRIYISGTRGKYSTQFCQCHPLPTNRSFIFKAANTDTLSYCRP